MMVKEGRCLNLTGMNRKSGELSSVFTLTEGLRLAFQSCKINLCIQGVNSPTPFSGRTAGGRNWYS